MVLSAPEHPAADPIETQLDDEIDALRAQVKELKSRRSIQVSTIITSRSTSAILSRLRSSKLPSQTTASTTDPNDTNPLHQAVLDRSKQQASHNQECLYRTCAGITTFKVQDPDPFAVNRGRVLGVRIEAFASGKFLRPYYIFLNKPYKGSDLLRVHRHTVPPCIPLAALATKYLPTPHTGADLLKARKQDFARFVRCLRREIAGYHNRATAIGGVRRVFGVEDQPEGEQAVVDVTAADAEAKQIRIEWTDGTVGRIVVDSKGEIQNCVITGGRGRDRELENRVLGGTKRIEDLVESLS